MLSGFRNSNDVPAWNPLEIVNLKGVFCGSGSDMMNDPRPIEAIVKLVDKPTYKDIQVLYLGTATYDLEKFQNRQTQRFKEMGCQISSLQVAENDRTSNTSIEGMKEIIDNADVIVVGGGNTLYAVDRWRNLNLIPLLRKAMHRGAVLTGGSAGAICWFDGGHSDSMDPDTYKNSMLKKFKDTSQSSSVQDESSSVSDVIKPWKYIRVPALGFIPGLICPHHDRVQSNGVLRATDFDRIIMQSPGELGIAIDHWAALVIDGEQYRVMSFTEKEGSVKEGSNEFATDGSGKPGIWIKEVDSNGELLQRVCPSEGFTKDLLRLPTCDIVNDDDALRQCRSENPQPAE
eukprot:scaffold5707_cov112-Cylindrotheca_fusiformis.AAC.10